MSISLTPVALERIKGYIAAQLFYKYFNTFVVETNLPPQDFDFTGFPLPHEDRNEPSLRFGSTILSRWPIDESRLLPLAAAGPDDPAPFPSWRMQVELLHARTNGIDVFSTHLAPPPGQAWLRHRQVLQIDDAVRELADPKAPLPPIICGDFCWRNIAIDV